MDEVIKGLLYQVLGYGFSMLLGVGILSFLQRGYLLKFIKVKSSMGKLVLLRIKEVSHWSYCIGKWEEGDLIFKMNKEKKRLSNVESSDLYRSLGIYWMDIDSKTWNILSVKEGNNKTGFDPEKMESLVTRALYKPPIDDVRNKIMMVLIVASILAGLISAYFGYNILNEMGTLTNAVNNVQSTVAQGFVVGTP